MVNSHLYLAFGLSQPKRENIPRLNSSYKEGYLSTLNLCVRKDVSFNFLN